MGGVYDVARDNAITGWVLLMFLSLTCVMAGAEYHGQRAAFEQQAHDSQWAVRVETARWAVQ